jgi:geranylgeranyl pyrophosphate synthase
MAATAIDLDAYVAAEAGRVDRTLAALLRQWLGRPAGTIDAVIRYGTMWGGKRLRPTVCVSVHRALTGDAPDALYELAAGLELVHAYSLMHDDLPCMDDDDTRRGRPSTHRAFGAAQALLAGAALIPMAGATAVRGAARLGLDAAVAAAIAGALARAAGGGGMVGGQLLDLRAEGVATELDDLRTIHALKTGALFAAAAEIGALAARAPERSVRACAAYGAHLGLAFQIADDVLEASSDAAVLGKPVDGDARLAKSTVPSRAGMETARELARAESRRAREALAAEGIESDVLAALADYAVARER